MTEIEPRPAGSAPERGVEVLVEPGDRRPDRRVLAGAVLAVLVAVVATAVAISSVRGDKGPAATVRSGPSSPPSDDTASPSAPPRVQLALTPGWQTLRADGDRMAVATRQLGVADVYLALLAHDDAAFSAFPPDAAVLVVGGDRLRAKYITDASGAARGVNAGGAESVQLSPDAAVIGPGPALALGPAKTLAGGVVVRLGDVPKSTLVLAAYFGPKAPAATSQQAEAMAATVHVASPTLDPGALPPPPPPGSRPGFDRGGVALAPNSPVVALTTKAPGVAYTVRADADCAVATSSVSTQAVGGGCLARPATGGADVVAVAGDGGLPPPPPGQSFAPGVVARWPQTMIVVMRVGPDVRRVTALLVDGRTADATVGIAGWAIVVTDGRAFLVQARDGAGTLVAQTPIS